MLLVDSPLIWNTPGQSTLMPEPIPCIEIMGTQRYASTMWILIFALCIALSMPCFLIGQTHWPSFRNDGTGITSAHSVPLHWSPEKGIAWRADIPGYGQSSPVVYGGRIFLTSMDGPWQENGYLHAFDLQTGKLLWTQKVPATTKVENYFRNSRAAPTCVVDDQIVVCFFPGGDVSAFSHEGQRRWTLPLFDEFTEVNNERGTASSLAQTDRYVIVLVDHKGPSYLVAIDKSDGTVAWKTDRGERVESWASPVIASAGNRNLVITSSANSVNVYDASSGKETWSMDNVYGNNIPSASVFGNSIFVGSTQMYGSTHDPATVAQANCRIDFSDERQPEFELKWGAQRANSYYSTPLAFAGYVYYVNKSGILYCETWSQVNVCLQNGLVIPVGPQLSESTKQTVKSLSTLC